MTLRILYLLNSLGGGASEGIYQSLPLLRQKGVLPFVVSPPGNQKDQLRAQKLTEDLCILPLTWWNRVDDDIARRLARTLGRWRHGGIGNTQVSNIAHLIKEWNIDIVHSTTSLVRDGALAAKSTNTPHIWHIKETIGSQYRVHFPLPDRELARFFCEDGSVVIVMSNYIAEFFRRHGFGNVEIMPDGVDIPAYQKGDSRNLRQQLLQGDNWTLIGMAASMVSDWKKHDVFIDMAVLMAERYRNTHFVILGPTPSIRARWPYDLSRKYYQNLVAKVNETGMSQCLTLYGFYSDPPDMMRSLDVLVHTCDIEPFGRVAIEAMAAGVPVVGPETGGIAETVVNGETGLLVTPNDPTAFADATARLLDDPALRRKFGATGQAYVLDRYSMEQYAARLIELYKHIIEKGI